jgi:hypothetical protein
VYLRRIFEKLIHDHHRDFTERNGPIKRFDTLRMDEKIGSLAEVLPPALVKNKATYGILSKGIHALDEATASIFRWFGLRSFRFPNRICARETRRMKRKIWKPRSRSSLPN